MTEVHDVDHDARLAGALEDGLMRSYADPTPALREISTEVEQRACTE
jgi:hypothetical protein